jgi:hypothetical protein
MTEHRVTLTDEELGLLAEALDSHRYWQLSDPTYRNSGYVQEPGSDDEENAAEIKASEQLEERLQAELRRHEDAEGKSDEDLDRELVRDIRNQLVHLNDRLCWDEDDPEHDAFERVLDAWDGFEEAYGSVEGGEREILS